LPGGKAGLDPANRKDIALTSNFRKKNRTAKKSAASSSSPGRHALDVRFRNQSRRRRKLAPNYVRHGGGSGAAKTASFSSRCLMMSRAIDELGRGERSHLREFAIP